MVTVGSIRLIDALRFAAKLTFACGAPKTSLSFANVVKKLTSVQLFYMRKQAQYNTQSEENANSYMRNTQPLTLHGRSSGTESGRRWTSGSHARRRTLMDHDVGWRAGGDHARGCGLHCCHNGVSGSHYLYGVRHGRRHQTNHLSTQ